MCIEKKYPLSLGLDHPTVQQVIDVAVELTKEHRLINTELLYNRAKKKLKIPRSGLKTIIQMLINRKILVDGSRFTNETILKNNFRQFIYRIIKTNIGIHFSSLKETCARYKDHEIGVGHLVWHLEKLIKFNLVKKVKVNNYTIFLPVEVSDEEGMLYFILSDGLNRAIVKLILDKKEINRAIIYKELNLEREKVYYRLKKLTKYGIISPSPEGEKRLSIKLNKRALISEVITNIVNNMQNNQEVNLISMEM
ncbi:MAG: hypothetical protein ACFFBP_00315 [Promethearchaeota archaeon]